jgi:RNase adapter protein RapZ
MRAIVITGLSGSGKSSAIKALEDSGYYCMDNVPVPLLRAIMGLSESRPGEEIQKIAVVIDARDQKHIADLPETIRRLTFEGHSFELVFLTASDEVLVRRFSETRRRHPLAPRGPLLAGIQKERELLAPVLELAAEVLDTTDLGSADLRQHIQERYGRARTAPEVTVQVVSFGYKYGLPSHADLVLDVRFLANPYFREDLKAKDGTDPDVGAFVMGQEDAQGFLTEVGRLFGFLLPRFDREGKSYLVVAVGCTGGKHRSVVIAQKILETIQRMGYATSLLHRDVGRG